MTLFAKTNEVSITSDELVGKFVMLEPKEATVVNTEKWGKREAIVARVFMLEGNEVLDHGNTLIFWKAVRNQLASVTSAEPLVAGFIEQAAGKDYSYYRLVDRTPDGFDAEAVSEQIAALR